MAINIRCGIVLALFLCATPSWAAEEMSDVSDFPLNPGNRWEYISEGGQREVLTVTRTVTTAGIPLTEMVRDGDPPFYYLRFSDGILRFPFLPGGDEENMPAPTLILQPPLRMGQTWTSGWSDPPMSFTVLSRGPLKVPAGNFPRAVKIGYRNVASPIYEGFVWFVPEIGIVAMEESGSRSELASYSVSGLLAPVTVQYSLEELEARLGFEKAGGLTKKGAVRRRTLADRLFIYLPGFLLALAVLSIVMALIWWLDRQSGGDVETEEAAEVLAGQEHLAAAMVQEGLFKDAAEILQRLISKHPQWPDLALQLGKVYRNMGSLDESALELKRALTLNPDLYAARTELARVYLQAGEPYRALEELDLVLSKNPSFADVHFLKGEVFSQMGQTVKAQEAYDAALAINPSFGEARKALARLTGD